EGLPIRQALVESSMRRLRPITLTTLTTVLGLLPLMTEQSFQAQFLIPMAISIAYGVISATVLILIVLPCLMEIGHDLRNVLHWTWFGRPAPSEAERGGRHRPGDEDEQAMIDGSV
ncbi:MAG: efflux RND transporter permease subunit, partial [Planctomycetota bacterium]